MGAALWSEDQFDPAWIRLADIDGSGATDLLYVGADGVPMWSSQAGNGWQAGTLMAAFPSQDAMSTVQTIDLLGAEACPGVVFAPAGRGCDAGALCGPDGGLKPHLLVDIANNLGTETRVTYAPSTRFYRADTGTPWVTRLPFPLQVVERLEVLDWSGATAWSPGTPTNTATLTTTSVSFADLGAWSSGIRKSSARTPALTTASS